MGEKLNVQTEADFHQMAFGQKGSRYLSGTDTGTAGEVYKAITALEETVITLTQPLGDTSLAITIPSGLTVVGKFTAVELTSGGCLAYIG